MNTNPAPNSSVADQLMMDLQRESQLMNLMIQGCIELHWAVGEEEKEISQAIIYNAFETYALERGMSLKEAEQFCEQHLEALIHEIWAVL